jgi:hypothetical protein
LRHYEILAAGAVPYFVGIENAPKGSLGLLPRDLLLEARKLPGVKLVVVGGQGDNGESVEPSSTTTASNNKKEYQLHVKRKRLERKVGGTEEDNEEEDEERNSFDESKWFSLAQRMLKYTRKHLTTRAIVSYMLRTIHQTEAKSVLLLGGNSQEDYVRDMLLHGLFSHKNLSVTVSPSPYHMFEDDQPSSYSQVDDDDDDADDESDDKRQRRSFFNARTRDKKDLYGSGFTYSKRIPNPYLTKKKKMNYYNEVSSGGDDSEKQDSSKNSKSIKEMIAAQLFDIIIYGSLHRGMPYLDTVLEVYPKVWKK